MRKSTLPATLLLAATLGLDAQISDHPASKSGANNPAQTDPSWRTQLDAQLKTLRRKVDTARAGGETTSPALAENLNDLGSAYFDQARFLDAERCYDEAISIWASRDSTNPKMGFALRNLAQLRVEQGRPSDGERLIRRAREIMGAAYGNDSVELAQVNIGLATALMNLRRTSEAATVASLALAALEPRGNSEHLGAALFLLGKAAWIQHHESDAELLLRRAAEVWRTVLGSQHPTYATGLVAIAELLTETHTSRSGPLFLEALGVFDSQLGPEHPYTAYTLLLYSRYLKSQGERREAGKLKRRAEAILAEHWRANQLGRTLDVNGFEPTRTRDHR
jgi:tetratricopeptide (TPR) repeat protein